MFNIFKSVKKIVGFEDKNANADKRAETGDSTLEKKINQLSNFFGKIFKSITSEHKIIKEKMKDLYRSNYDLGIKHLKNGNVKEAIFRFRIIRKFWPNNYDAYYQLIYCLMLNNELEEAQKIIDDLLIRNPNDKEKINKLLSRKS